MFQQMNQGLPDGQAIEALMREKAKPSLTKAELREQRISWVMGMMPRGGAMSLEQVEKFIDSRYG